jgi:hypothetical protein
MGSFRASVPGSPMSPTVPPYTNGNGGGRKKNCSKISPPSAIALALRLRHFPVFGVPNYGGMIFAKSNYPFPTILLTEVTRLSSSGF